MRVRARTSLCGGTGISSVVVVRRRSSSFGSSEALVEAFSGYLIVRAEEEALSSVFVFLGWRWCFLEHFFLQQVGVCLSVCLLGFFPLSICRVVSCAERSLRRIVFAFCLQGIWIQTVTVRILRRR